MMKLRKPNLHWLCCKAGQGGSFLLQGVQLMAQEMVKYGGCPYKDHPNHFIVPFPAAK
jgi:hypothetical protein